MSALYAASIPVFTQLLGSLSACLKKGAAHAEAKKFDAAVLAGARLAPDMFPLSRQVQIATDHAKGAAARLAGLDVPVYEDNEKTLDDLQARIAKALAYVKGVSAAQFAGAETRDIKLKMGGMEVTWKGPVYLHHFALPNFYFHTTSAYNILRHNGVEVGKRDFIGSF